MSGGVVYRDLIAAPEVTEPDRREQSNSIRDVPTTSHALAVQSKGVEAHGAAHEDHDGEVKDLGWHKPEEQIPSPLVGRLPNDDLWLLLRRFNKVSTYVLRKISILIIYLANVPC